MAFKFFNIGKANEEIARLEAENAQLKKDLSDAQTNATEIEKQPAQLAADLETAHQAVAAAIKERDEARQALDAANKAHSEKVAALNSEHAAELEKAKKPSAQALAIVSAQGVPNPLPQTSSAAPNAVAKPDVSKLTGIDKAIAIHKAEYAAKGGKLN